MTTMTRKMFNLPSRRVYLGRLPSTFQKRDVEKHLSSYGTIVECKVMDGFGFVEFSKLQEAEDVVDTFSRHSFLGEQIVIEFAKPPRHVKECSSFEFTADVKFRPISLLEEGVAEHDYAEIRIPPPHAQLRYCVWVYNLSHWTRWQDLKDFGRTGGATVAYSDIDSLDHTLGFIEYLSSEDAKRAVQMLDKTELRGNIVRVRTQQQVNRDRASKRAHSRSRSPARHRHEQPEDYVRREREDHAWNEWEAHVQAQDKERYHHAWDYRENSTWWLHDTARHY